MTQARELSKQDYRAIMDAAIIVRQLLGDHMDDIHEAHGANTEWHELYDLSKLASVITQTAYRASREAVDADAPVAYILTGREASGREDVAEVPF